MVFIQEGKAFGGSYRLALSLSDHSGQVRAEQTAAADALQCPLPGAAHRRRLAWEDFS